MDATKTRRNAVEQFTQRSPRHEPEVEESIDAYQQARATIREALMLELRFTDGSIESFDYARLGRARLEPQGRIILRFGKEQVTVEGKNLKQLFAAITEHRRRFIQQGTAAEEGLKPDDAEHVDVIRIEPMEEEL